MSARCLACEAIHGPGTPWATLSESRCGDCGGALPRAGVATENGRWPALDKPQRFTLEESPAFMLIGFRRVSWVLLQWLLLALWFGGVLVMSWNDPETRFFRVLGEVGVGVFALSVAQMFATTRVAIGRTTLEIHHGPLPLQRAQSLPVGSVQQLYVVARRRLLSKRDYPEYTYGLMALRADGSRVELVRGLPSYADARFLEFKLETFLGIAPARVEGEVQPE